MKLLAVSAIGVAAKTLLSQGRKATTPENRVLQLLDELSSSLVTEAQEEEDAFGKFRDGATAMISELQGGIGEAKNDIESLSAQILTENTQAAALGAQIKTNRKSLDGSNADLDEAKERFAQQNQVLVDNTNELQKAITTVGKAVDKLQGARQPSGRDGPRLISSDVDDVKQTLSGLKPFAALAPEAFRSLDSYMKDVSLLSTKSAGLETVVGTLTQMQKGFATDLARDSMELKNAREAFEATNVSLLNQIRRLEGLITDSSKRKAELEKNVVENSQEKSETEKMMTSDQLTLTTVSENFESQTRELKLRQDDRVAERNAIRNAIDILGGTSGAHGQTTLIQHVHKKPSPVTVLRQLSVKLNSHKMALVATKAGKFDGREEDGLKGILEMLDEQIQETQAQMDLDEQERDECLANKANLNGDSMSHKAEHDRIQNEISMGETSSKQMTQALAESEKEITDKQEVIAAATQEAQEKEAFIKSEIARVNHDIGLIQEAISALGEYYNFAQQLPEPELEPPAAAEEEEVDYTKAHFNESREGAKKGGSSVVQILQMLADDTKNSLGGLESDLKKAQDDYQSMRNEMNDSVSALSTLQDEQEAVLLESKQAVADAKKRLGTNEESGEALAAEHVAHVKNCEWIKEVYGQRKEEFTQDIEQYRLASSVLAAGPSE